MLPKLGISPGFALDLTVDDEDGLPWDFTNEDKKSKAIGLTIETEPDLVVGSPACTDFSPWQRLNKLSVNTRRNTTRQRKRL